MWPNLRCQMLPKYWLAQKRIWLMRIKEMLSQRRPTNWPEPIICSNMWKCPPKTISMLTQVFLRYFFAKLLANKICIVFYDLAKQLKSQYDVGNLEATRADAFRLNYPDTTNLSNRWRRCCNYYTWNGMNCFQLFLLKMFITFSFFFFQNSSTFIFICPKRISNNKL